MKFVIAFLVLSIIVIVHEFGHYIIAKASGVAVVEFSLGFGPRLLKFKRKGTMYSIKLLPFGGSCRMLGFDEEETGERSFNSVSVWKRMAIMFAGPMANFLLALILSVIIIGTIGYDPCVIYGVAENSPAAEAGLLSGDHIVKINNQKITFYGDYSLYMLEYEGKSLNIEYERDEQKYTTTLIPQYVDEDRYQMGVLVNTDEPSLNSVTDKTPAAEAGLKAGDLIVSIDGQPIVVTDDISAVVNKCEGNEIEVVVERDGEQLTFNFVPDKVHQQYYNIGMSMANAYEKCNPIKTLGYSFEYTGYWIKAVFKSFKLLFTGKASVNDLSGPVGIVSAIGDVVEESRADGAFWVFINLVNWGTMISANLGVMNLLPIPALDGGRILFLIIEAIRRKPIPREKEGMIHFIGIVLLMILMVAILFNDIRKLF